MPDEAQRRTGEWRGLENGLVAMVLQGANASEGRQNRARAEDRTETEIAGRAAVGSHCLFLTGDNTAARLPDPDHPGPFFENGQTGNGAWQW